MISEGSCDIEDWSNDAENSALITGIHFYNVYREKNIILNYNNISQFCCFYCGFNQINAALVSRIIFKNMKKKILPTVNQTEEPIKTLF